MKKKLVSFVCAVMAALCLVVSVPAQAYAASEDETLTLLCAKGKMILRFSFTMHLTCPNLLTNASIS